MGPGEGVLGVPLPPPCKKKVSLSAYIVIEYSNLISAFQNYFTFLSKKRSIKLFAKFLAHSEKFAPTVKYPRNAPAIVNIILHHTEQC